MLNRTLWHHAINHYSPYFFVISRVCSHPTNSILNSSKQNRNSKNISIIAKTMSKIYYPRTPTCHEKINSYCVTQKVWVTSKNHPPSQITNCRQMNLNMSGNIVRVIACSTIALMFKIFHVYLTCDYLHVDSSSLLSPRQFVLSLFFNNIDS